MQANDSELGRRIRAGDEAAFHELMERHADGLFGLAFTLMGNAADAEDVVQETFLGAYRRRGSFEGRSSPRTWLVRILMNQASKARRYRRVRRAMSIDSPEQNGSMAGAALQTAPAASAVESRADVDQMLETLSDEHRQVLVLRELQQMSYEEIAQTLAIPRGTVESRLHRARNQLRQRFKNYLT